jgi:hypothetical protein
VPNKLKSGDQVAWNTPQGKTRGKVIKRLTTATKIKGHIAKPSEAHPEYLVESDKTGARAAHKPAALKKT